MRSLELKRDVPADDGPVAIEVNAFCQRYAVGRSKAYQLIANGSVVAKKMGSKTLVDAQSARDWFDSLPALPSRISPR